MEAFLQDVFHTWKRDRPTRINRLNPAPAGLATLFVLPESEHSQLV